MNAFELEIEKYERRIKRIEDNPSSGRLASNKFLYEIMRDYHQRLLERAQRGYPIIYHWGAEAPVDLLRSMDMMPLHVLEFGDRSVRNAPRYLDLTVSKGFAVDICSRSRTGNGICLAGELPPPHCVLIMGSGNCENMALSSQYFAHYYNVPSYKLDVPLQEDTETRMSYIVEELEGMIRFLEERFGVTYSEERLAEMQQSRHEYQLLFLNIANMLKAPPSPIHARDLMRRPHRDVTEPRLVEYVRLMRDEIKEKVERGECAVGEEKLRVLWLQTPPLFKDVFTFLEQRGVSVPITELGLDPTILSPGGIENIEKYSLLEQEAHQMCHDLWGSPVETRIDRVRWLCQEFKIDAIIHSSQWGCHKTMNGIRLVADVIESEMGIPTLMMEGDCWDVRNFNEAEYYGKLEDFVNMCLMLKDDAI